MTTKRATQAGTRPAVGELMTVVAESADPAADLRASGGQWTCIAVNDAWGRLAESPAALLVGEPVGALLPDRIVAEALGRLCDLAALTSSARRLVTPSVAGAPWLARATPRPPGEDGHAEVRLILARLDVGAVDHAEMRRALDQQSPELMAEFGPDLRVTAVNQAVTAVSGLTAEEITGRTNREMGYPAPLADMWDSHHRRVFRTGQACRVSYVLATVLGPRQYESHITPRLDAEGRVVAVRVVSREVLARPGRGSGGTHESATWLRCDPVPAAVARARRQVREWLVSIGCEGLVDRAVLVVSELVTNAIMHAGTDLYVHVQQLGDVVRIEVLDGVPTLPRARPAGSVGGRGLGLVAAVAGRWGAHVTPSGGKVVWCEFGPRTEPAWVRLSADALLDVWAE